jgi:aryl-alcohol dehydrogenase-like predicted oxidoreductase
MKKRKLERTNLLVSRFIFGTSSLHHIGNLREQADHLRAAVDAGFSHFDTAPLYGFGSAEEAIGLAFNRNVASDTSITLTTKVGRYAPGGGSHSRLSMLGRKAVGKVIPGLSRPQVDWSVARARASLDASLTRLRREQIDILLLHEPDQGLINTDEWLRWLEAEVDNRVKNFGICGEISHLVPFVSNPSVMTKVVQARDSWANCEADQLADCGHFPQLTFGYLASSFAGESAASVLRGALSRNRDGAILVSTRKRARLHSFADLAASEGAGQP